MGIAAEAVAPQTRRVRAYFAPVDRTARQPAVFDPAQLGGFALDAPPAAWVDLGWIAGFARTCGTKLESVKSGAPAVAQMQVRAELESEVSFSFESWGKLQIALAAGTQQMNLLATQSGAAASASGGAAVGAVSLLAGSTATVLQMEAADAASFAAGQMVVVDVDYAGSTGFIGSGVSGAYVKNAVTDVDYVRRVSLNVGRIAAIENGAVTLEQPLLAGVPADGMKVSRVVGFCDREGSSFFQEWSAVFVAEGQQGERVVWHYPRLQTLHGIAESTVASAGGYSALRLAGAFRALPVKDALDGETVLCFRSYIAG